MGDEGERGRKGGGREGRREKGEVGEEKGKEKNNLYSKKGCSLLKSS